MNYEYSTQSWLRIRDYAELFTWLDPNTHRPTEGFNPPPDALRCRHKPFHLRAIASDGHPIEGDVISCGFDHRLRLRKVKFVASGEIRPVYDMFIISIDKVRFVTH